jgi:hypothetical protein
MGQLSPLMRKDLFSRLLDRQSEDARIAKANKPGARQVKVKSAWECASCGDLHSDMGAAAECCDPVPSSAFECGRCDSLYRSREKAEKCCAGRTYSQIEPSAIKDHGLKSLSLMPLMRSVECPVCGEDFGEEGDQEGNEAWPYAARCCLGADLSPAQTWEIGRLARYARLDWLDAIAKVTDHG